MDITKVLNSFNGVKPQGHNHWMAICPCHNDENASLSITNTGNKILLKCFSGCNTADVLGAAGLDWSDIGSESKKRDLTVFDRIAYGQQDRYGENIFVKDHYDYIDEDGTYLYTKVRFEGGNFGNGEKKLIRYYQIDYANDSFQHGKPEGCKKVLYRLPKLLKAINDGFPVYIVEGEKDVRTLERFYWTATTPGGSNDWLPEFARYFKGADVRILPDNDKVGQDLANRIAADLRNYAYRVRIVKTSQAPKGDVTDYLNEGDHNKDTLLALVNEATCVYAPWIEIGKNSETVNTDKLARTFDRQEDYILARSSGGAKTYDFIYQNGLYAPCDSNQFKGKISDYYGFGKVTANSVKNAYEILHFRGSHFHSMDELNADESIINLNNGVLHINDMRFEKHNPKYLTTYRVNVDYDPNAKTMPYFTKFIREFCIDEEGEVDNSKIMVIQELFGLLFSNVPGYRPKKAFIFHAMIGNSGKSKLMLLIQAILGEDRCYNLPIHDLSAEGKNRFVLGRLPSVRLVCAGELSTNDVEDSANFKRMTGGDPITIEQKGIDPVTFHFKGVIVYACNALPSIKDDKGDQIFDRIMLIPCQHTVPVEERDPTMLEKMLTEKSAIFNWGLAGLRRLIDNNYHFTECQAISNTVELYREKIDTVSRFLEANGYMITADRKDVVNAKTLFEQYKAYCENKENEIMNYITTSQSFADRLAGRGVIKKQLHGNWVFRGIKEGFMSVSDSDGVPFKTGD